MKIFYISFFLSILNVWSIKAQTLNQPANWPNSNWIIEGSYNTNQSAFNADPSTTEHFSFNDRNAGYGHPDEIAAVSPVIDLTAAYNAGETLLSLSVQYNYKDYSYVQQTLTIMFWTPSLGMWIPWHVVQGNIHQQGDYCYREKSRLLMTGLDISNFSASELSNFKYKIIYSDNNNSSFGYGFCFDSPTLKSNAPISVPDCALNPYPADGAIDVPAGPINLTWQASTTGGPTEYYDVFFQNQYQGSFEETSLHELLSNNQYSNTFSFKAIPINIAGPATSCPTWTFTVEDDPQIPPVNDICSGAIPISIAPSGTGCTNPILLNNHNANNSTVLSGIPSASCANQDNNSGDLWYSFIAPASGSFKITNMVAIDIWDAIGYVLYDGCNATSEVICNVLEDNNSYIHSDLTPGATYYLRLFSPGNPPFNNFKYICMEEYIPASSVPDNDECDNAETLNVQYNKPGFVATTQTQGTIYGATDSGTGQSTCNSNPIPNDDVWYKFTAGSPNINITINDNYTTNCTVELFSGDCSNLSQIDCASANENPTINATGLTIGEDYYVNVFSDLDVIPSEPSFGISIWTNDDNQIASTFDTTFNNLKIFPNPIENILTLQSDYKINEIIIYTALGKQQIINNPNNTKVILNLSNLNSGYYFMKILVDKVNTKTFKIIKK